ncbi:hypothetical protein LRS06_18790 [Hymenobacter sp. J193]|uniref:hypothetical protein n=1 Tax=Hymenobacter sp. J193 TaxID=2898429 RepID=UPI002150DF94|nr:hypothetical protein [Hymenobacter sp. J193]MCR5889778.1 hypothetical protein [Hymenobacter sp. J193]
MHPLLESQLQVAADCILHTSAEVIQEGDGNLFYLFLPPAEIQRLAVADLEEWVLAVVDMKRKQLVQQSEAYYPMCFYCWYDGMAGYLSFSMVAATYEHNLPFRRTLQSTNLATVLHEAIFPDSPAYANEITPDTPLAIWKTLIP